ncbi:DUF4124 domain-containing protein [Alkanindiges sp. WGS2144]|uniref:DUF4124 domain-containing protein n=1 Tax=Alkanindiges sp. WGS2144 TaxID=3366808 RepID=UPI0037524664
MNGQLSSTGRSTIKMSMLLVLAAVSAGAVQAQPIYKWKDAKGATHYSQTPPPAHQAQALNIKARATPPSPAPGAPTPTDNKSTTDPTTPNTASAKPAPQKLSPEACQQLKANLELLQSGRRLFESDAGGERAYLTEEQKDVRIQSYSQNLAQGCR